MHDTCQFRFVFVFLQFFVVKALNSNDAKFNEFQVSGTTYAPEGKM